MRCVPNEEVPVADQDGIAEATRATAGPRGVRIRVIERPQKETGRDIEEVGLALPQRLRTVEDSTNRSMLSFKVHRDPKEVAYAPSSTRGGCRIIEGM